VNCRFSATFVQSSTGRTEHKHVLERQRDEVVTRNHIDRLLLEITHELVGLSSREAVERTVCERLAGSDFHQFAWIGERAFDGGGIVSRVRTGDDSYLEEVTADRRAIGSRTVERALETGEVQVASRHAPRSESRRTETIDRRIRSVAAIPLRHGETTHGVLAVSTTRPGAFDRRERAGFEIFGETVGFVINALKHHELLFADRVVELEFSVTVAGSFLVRQSEQFACTLSIEGSATSTSGAWLLYANSRGVSPATLRENAGGVDGDGIEHVRVIRDDPADGLLEYHLDRSCLLGTLAEVGGRLRSARATKGTGRVVVEIPQTVDVREVVEQIREGYAQMKLVAKRERDRSVGDVGIPDARLDQLTDRQQEVLETAYRAGYFDWPHESTAEEVADSLGISSPTLHRHLRRSEKKLLATFFETTGA
jgi:DNA-binding CsgD family transcriptional regulator